jgi:hypothetical protein
MKQGEKLMGDAKSGNGQRSGAARPHAPERPKQQYSYSNPNPFHRSLYCYGRFFYIQLQPGFAQILAKLSILYSFYLFTSRAIKGRPAQMTQQPLS